MQAVQYRGINDVVMTEVPEPEVLPGHALVRVTASGVCRTDVHVRRASEQIVPSGVILGHEIAGVIERIEGEAQGLAVGDDVIVHPVWSCGSCRMCRAGLQNACRSTGARMAPAPTPGVSVNGGMADYISVPLAAVIPAAGLESSFAASLTDAGIVPYHSIKAVSGLLEPGSTAVVIGIGGLGQYAVQMLRELTAVTVIALDINDDALGPARQYVDHAFRADDKRVVEQILELTGGYGAEFVLDLVGSSTSMELAGHIIAPYGAVRVPGLSDGVFGFDTSMTQESLPWGASLTRPYSGTYEELNELVALARTGRITANVVPYTFDQALQAFDDLESGKVHGRAVILMDK